MNPSRSFEVGKILIGGTAPLFLIAGPCVIESETHATTLAERIRDIAASLGVPLIFKASYDKANRSSISSYRGPGLEEGLRILASIKKRTGLPLLTDVHEVAHVARAAEVCDVLQIPAFLSRQTDLLIAAGRSGPFRGCERERERRVCGPTRVGARTRARRARSQAGANAFLLYFHPLAYRYSRV